MRKPICPHLTTNWETMQSLSHCVDAPGHNSVFEKRRAQATSPKETPSSKLKNRRAHRLSRHPLLGVWCLRFGTSLELGFGAWCFAQRRNAVGLLRWALRTILPVGTSDPRQTGAGCAPRDLLARRVLC